MSDAKFLIASAIWIFLIFGAGWAGGAGSKENSMQKEAIKYGVGLYCPKTGYFAFDYIQCEENGE